MRTLLLALCLLLAGCTKPYPHTLRVGDVVTVKLDGQRVQVTDIHERCDLVRVRVPLAVGGYKYIDIEESALTRP